jgi:uncharacterized protein (TIGR02118 family)
MITRFGFAPRRPGLEIKEFQRHWGTQHGRLAGGLAGLKRYWQNHAVLRGGEPLLPWPGFDACSELDFRSVQDMNAAFAAEHYQVAVREDEKYLVDKVNGGMVVGRRVGKGWKTPGEGVRLVTFLRLAPGRAKGDLIAALKGMKPASAGIGRELIEALEPAEAEGYTSLYDAIDIQWFKTAKDAESFAVSADARMRRARLGALVRGTDQVIAKVRVIL